MTTARAAERRPAQRAARTTAAFLFATLLVPVCSSCDVLFVQDRDRDAVATCVPQCDGKDCGDDGCGSPCGTCEFGWSCHEGICAADCQPACFSKECGNDGCGGSCGSCSSGASCESGTCVTPCKPSCGGKDCGGDGCGGSCGSCGGGAECVDGTCCTPDCEGRVCGSDGCHGSCGTCSSGLQCDGARCLSLPPGTILIPAGEFTMGCAPSVDDECASFNDENPGHEVWLDAYAIHETEVTVAAYSKCVNSGECSPPGTGSGCNWNKAGKEGHPVNCVTWDQADAYCRWADKELPTEAQWEKAARGEKPRKYPWGGTSPSCEAELAIMLEVEFGGCGTSVTWKVGSMPDGASPYDVLDMAGNVREWVADVYDNNYYGESPARNPRGPGGGSVVRVLRGGGLDSDAKGLRTSEREYNDGSSPSYDVGFRCALWVDW